MENSRKKVDFNSLPIAIQEMIEDNASAAAIIDELIQTKGETSTLATLIILDDMNIRGIQINNLYKLNGQDIDKFYEKALTMTKEDVEQLNFESFAVCKHKAIYDGSQEDRYNNPEKYLFTDEERNEMRNIKSKKRVQDILNDNQIIKTKEIDDLYPSIKSKEALSIINKNGFTCGYKKTYENEHGQSIIYRVFYNELGDIIYTHSLENPDIFLWGQSKLNVVRQNTIENYEELGCNAYVNIDGVVGYNIELREKPFNTYKKIKDRNEPLIKNIKHTYFDSNLFPIIESLEGIRYKEMNKNYKSLVISEIYNLLTFPETYYDLDDELKKIYKVLLDSAEDKAYDEIIYQLNSEKGIEVANELQTVLGINLDREHLIEAKKRFCSSSKKHFKVPKMKFLSDFVTDDPIGKPIDKRINKIIDNQEIS